MKLRLLLTFLLLPLSSSFSEPAYVDAPAGIYIGIENNDTRAGNVQYNATDNTLEVKSSSGTWEATLNANSSLPAANLSGLVPLANGGVNLDISTIGTGDVLGGASAGVIEIIDGGAASDGDVLTIQADGTANFETPAAGGGGGFPLVQPFPALSMDASLANAPDELLAFTNANGRIVYARDFDSVNAEEVGLQNTFGTGVSTNLTLIFHCWSRSGVTGTVQFAAQEVGGTYYTSDVYNVSATNINTENEFVWSNAVPYSGSAYDTYYIEAGRHPSNATAQLTGDLMIRKISVQQDAE